MTKPRKYTIPPKERQEWRDLVNAQINHKFQNYVLQLKTVEYNRRISAGELTVQEAIDEMYELCDKYAVAVQNDFKHIFKEW